MTAMPTTDPRVRDIIDCVSEQWGVPVRTLLSDRREKGVACVRHAAMTLAYEMTPHSFPALGRMFRRDHTTVMYAVRRCQALAEHDLDYAARLAKCRDALAPVGAS